MAELWCVVIEGEDLPDVVGPFRSKATADKFAVRWNDSHDPDDGCYSWPLFSVKEILRRDLGMRG